MFYITNADNEQVNRIPLESFSAAKDLADFTKKQTGENFTVYKTEAVYTTSTLDEVIQEHGPALPA